MPVGYIGLLLPAVIADVHAETGRPLGDGLAELRIVLQQRAERRVLPWMVQPVGKVHQVLDDLVHQFVVRMLTRLESRHLALQQRQQADFYVAIEAGLDVAVALPTKLDYALHIHAIAIASTTARCRRSRHRRQPRCAMRDGSRP